MNHLNANTIQTGNAAPVRLPEVESEIERIAIAIDSTARLVEELELRFTKVLAQRNTTGQTETSSPEPIRVPLAETLHTKALNIETIASQLRSILERVEL